MNNIGIIFSILLLMVVAVAFWLGRRPLPDKKLKKLVLHCMVDLETLSLNNNAYIRSIGACFFDEYGTGARFYESCDGPPQEGAHIDPETMAWWARQSTVAREALVNTKDITLKRTLRGFCEWIREEELAQAHEYGCEETEVWVWGNGSDFDNVVLQNAYKREGLIAPWMWYNSRCYRTMKNVFRDIKADIFDGEKHNAIADAVHQAKHAAKILRHVYGDTRLDQATTSTR